MSSDPQWRCVVCNKPKDLRGNHLAGKTKVRSDCWPCAVKREFVLDSAPIPDAAAAAAVLPTPVAKPSAAPPSSNPFAPAAPASNTPFAKVAANPFTSAAPTSTIAPSAAPAPNPFAKAAPNPFTAKPTPSPSEGAASGQSSKPAANPFAASPAAPTAAKTPAAALFKAPPAKSPFAGVFGAPTANNPFLNPSVAAAPGPKSQSPPATSNTSSTIVMQSQSPSKPSPPFTFVTAKQLVTPVPLGPTATQPGTARAFSADDTWKCVKCGKAKDLRGDHLAGKSTIRSDCWPCAVKRVFVRHDPNGEPFASTSNSSSPDSRGPGSKPSPILQQQRTNSTPDSSITSSFASCVVPCNTPATPSLPPAGPVSVSTASSPFVDPIVPSASDEVHFFVSSLSSVSSPRVQAEASRYAEGLFSQVRRALLGGGLDEGNVHVAANICTVFVPSSASTETVGALLLAAEMRLGRSRGSTGKSRRIFTDSVPTFAAACLYKLSCGDDAMTVFGPQEKDSSLAAIIAHAGGIGDALGASGSPAASKGLFLRTGTVVPVARSGSEARRLSSQPKQAVADSSDIVLVSSCAPTKDEVLEVAKLL